MKWLSPRLLIYLVAILAFMGLVQWQKSRIQNKNTAEVFTILSEHIENGTPVDIMKIEISPFLETRAVTLSPCGLPEVCVQVTNELRTMIRSGSILYDQSGRNPIGRVTQVSGRMDFTTALYPVRARLQNDVKIENGFLTAQLQVRKEQKSLVVPLEAVSFEDNQPTAWVLEDRAPVKRQIKLGSTNSYVAEVIEGLSEGEDLIVEGHRRLQEKQKVQVRKTLSLRDLVLLGGLQ